MLIVDHYAENNNYINEDKTFYDQCINLKPDGYVEENFKGVEFIHTPTKWEINTEDDIDISGHWLDDIDNIDF